MAFLSIPIPQISISPATPEERSMEPRSPFVSLAFNTQDEDGFRPLHLTPPPSATTGAFKRRSPTLPVDKGARKGLDSEQFLTLLNATKERMASGGGKRGADLRKEIALKVHKNKQAERRALFLSKVHAPPSPTATMTPKTPPDSPAIFHYSLPSPGLVSPLALFESLNEDSYSVPHTWVEQVDFRLSEEHQKQKEKAKRGLPSLDQISARLIPRNGKPDVTEYHGLSVSSARPSVGVGRLRMPLRTQPHTAIANPTIAIFPPPSSPTFPQDLHVTTLVVPKSATASHVELTETNLNALNSRGQRAHNMLSTLKRRTLSSECLFTSPALSAEADTKWKRRSAPAEIQFRPRIGFEHAVLALPGGF